MAKKRLVIWVCALTVVAAIVAAVVILPNTFDRHIRRIFVGSEQVHELAEAPDFLTEELALSIAWRTLHQDGFDTNLWRPMPDDRSSSPEGTPDEYLVRNFDNPNRGSVDFSGPTGSVRYVSLQLESNRITSYVVVPK